MPHKRVFSLVILLCATAATALATPIYTGELLWDQTESQLHAGADWANTATKIAWTVEKLGPGLWSYTYELTVYHKDISHLIIETSDSINTLADVTSSVDLQQYDGNSYKFDVYSSTAQGNSNPNMPDAMYGVKFDLAGESTTITISFQRSNRDPVWGDFYAKDGKTDGVDNYVYNAGFTANDQDPDPDVYGPDSLLVTDHILVPDTTFVEPEPATLALLCAGAGMVLARRRGR